MSLRPCNLKALLVVDDDPTIRELFTTIASFDLPEMEVRTASNGADGVEAFQKQHPAVVTMDLMMPVMDGFEAVKRIAELCAKNNWVMPAVVFCTGFAPPAGLDQLVGNRRKTALLHKPVTAGQLVAAIQAGVAEVAAIT